MTLRKPIVIISDTRFEAARQTNHGAGRGWDFSPAKRRRRPVHLIRTCLVLGVGCLVLGALWLL